MRAVASALTGPRRGWLYAAAVGLLGAVLLSASSAGAYLSASRWVDHTLEVRQESYEWLTMVLDAEVAARDVIATHQPSLVDVYEQDVRGANMRAGIVRTLATDNPIQVGNVDAAAGYASALLGHLSAMIALVQAGDPEDARVQFRAGVGRPDLDAFEHEVRQIRADEERLLEDRRVQVRYRGWLTSLGALILVLTSSGLLLVAWRSEQDNRAALSRLAADARDRLARLSHLAAALAEARTRSEVAAVVVEQGTRAVGADTCTLYMLDQESDVLELIADRGVAPEVLDAVRRISATSKDPSIFTAWKSGTPTWAESDKDYAALQPSLAAMPERRTHAFWSVPLVAEESSVGLLGAGFYAPRRFSADERAFVETLAKQCAQALLRATRLEREDEARQWLVTTLRSIGDAVIATDPEGRVTFMNPIAETLTGWSEKDAQGRPLEEIFAIFSEETRQPVESPVAKVLREGKVVGLANHTVLRSKRGTEIPIDDSGAPIRSEGGQIRGVVLVFRDASDEKRSRVRSEFLAKAGEALVSSIDYEATLATVARVAVPAFADWCAVELVEPGTSSHRQVSLAHVDPSKVALARDLAERYPPDPRATTGLPQVIRSGKSELYAEIPAGLLEASARDAEHLRILRGLRLESAMVVALRAHGRTFGAMTFIYADSGRRYTEDDLAFAEDFARRAAMAIENALSLREAEEARAKERWLRGEAELASRSKDEFLATVSHELRTPLNAILNWAVILRTRSPPEGLAPGLATIERNARAQAKLIEDILDVSRIISGKLALNLGPTKIVDAVQAAIETVTPAAAAKEITIVSENSDVSLIITADGDRLQQVVWNLLSNAVKFTPKGGRVQVTVYLEGSDVCLRVTDSGEGIASSVLPFVFERFQQADASTTRRHGGLGLGLAIVKQLVSAHGGSVRAESEGRDKGATFVVRIPARSAVSAVIKPGDSPSLLDAENPATHGPRLDGLRLLVIDDEPDAREVVGEVLRARGAAVALAASVAEALERFASVKPDVIVSDIGMPEADGYELIRKIRALPDDEGGRTPAVALTAYARSEDAQKAFIAGYQVHIAKPVEPAELAVAVADLGRVGRADDASGESGTNGR